MKRLNPKTNKPFKKGDINQEGRVFKNYRPSKGVKKDGFYREEWFSSKEAYEDSKKYNRAESYINGKESINPITKKKYQMFDKCSDGTYFHRYNKSAVDKDNFWKILKFQDIDSVINYKIRRALRGAKDRASSQDVLFEIDAKYLLSIFPKNFRCPVIDIDLTFNKNKDGSIHLDKINPGKGYIKHNVIFISAKANRLKSNASSKDLFMVSKWLKSVGY